MTETLHRPPRPRPAARRERRPDPLRAGLPAAVWALVAGLVSVAVPVLLAWAADSRSGSGAADALSTVGQVWLAAHGTALAVPGGELDLLPLGLLAVPVLVLLRAGRHAASVSPVRTLREALRLTMSIALPYAVLAAVVAALSVTDDVQPAPVQALLGGLGIAALAAGTGVLRAAGLLPALRSAVPGRLRVVLTAAGGALAALLGVAGLLLAGSLVLHAGQVTDLARATGPGLVGGIALLLLGVLLVPVGVVWAACWLVGSGFAIGVGTVVGPFGSSLGPVPALPLLASLPDGPVPAWVGVLVLVVPISTGVLAGWLVHRGGGSMLDAALTGPVAGLALAVLAAAGSGPVGGERLSEVGPTAWLTGLLLAGEVTLGATAVIGVLVLRARRAARSAG